MNTDRNALYADLGSGRFELDRLTVDHQTVISEVRLLNGGSDRRVIGGTKKLVLEGRYGIRRDGAFFRTMFSGLEGSSVTDAEIGGVTYAKLYAEKAILTGVDDSGIGKFTVTLCEL